MYFTNSKVDQHNHNWLKACNQLVKKLKAHYIGSSASKADFDDADSISVEFSFCLSARVMFSQNLKTENGLVNSSMAICRTSYRSTARMSTMIF